jgi:hypothetical protein
MIKEHLTDHQGGFSQVFILNNQLEDPLCSDEAMQSFVLETEFGYV